jgi:hypothetical protein
MWLLSAFAVSDDTNLATTSFDLVVGPDLNTPTSVAVMTAMNGISPTGTPTLAFAGIQSALLQDPATGVQSGLDFTTEQFSCAPVLMLAQGNCLQITIVVGAQAAGSGLFTGSNTTAVSGAFQIILDPFI